MKAYITSIGEKTAGVCEMLMKRYGFETVLMDEKISWIEKYELFIKLAGAAGENCLRIDADIIPNERVKDAFSFQGYYLMKQFSVYDCYKNGVHKGQPVFYNKDVFPVILKNIHKLDVLRPETSAWRLQEVNPRTLTLDIIAGSHGYFQDGRTIARARKNKLERGQLGEYDFDLVSTLYSL